MKPLLLISLYNSFASGKYINFQAHKFVNLVPLPPSNLKLETFQSLVLSMEGIFGEVQFTLDVPGIKAVWEGPKVGICDCYVAAISPPDGRVARPEENLRVS